jgi:hypothetical protein
MAANIFLGVGVNFGVAGDAVTGVGIGTFKLQTQKHSKSREKDVVKDADGTDVQATLYNPTEEASFEYVVSGATTNDAVGTQTKIPEIGTKITVTSTKYAELAGTAWFVWNDPELSRSNTGDAKVTLHLKRWLGTDGITAVST